MKSLKPLFGQKDTKVFGININAWAKIIGITPAVKIFKGIWVAVPPYTFLPITLFAYWTGIFLVPVVIHTTNKVIRNININKIIYRYGLFAILPESHSIWSTNGNLARIPHIIIKDIPFPKP